jgi:hypothetical protein
MMTMKTVRLCKLNLYSSQLSLHLGVHSETTFLVIDYSEVRLRYRLYDEDNNECRFDRGPSTSHIMMKLLDSDLMSR